MSLRQTWVMRIKKKKIKNKKKKRERDRGKDILEKRKEENDSCISLLPSY